MSSPQPSVTLFDTASDWTRFRSVLGASCQLAEEEFRRMAMPERLQRLVARLGDQVIIDEINAILKRLRVSHDQLENGFSCDLQPVSRRITLGWLVSPYDDPVFRHINACRFLPALVRFERKVAASLDEHRREDVRRQVTRIVSRTS